MADKKELFNILEEADGEGAGLSKRQVGDAVNSANEAPVLPAEDSSGNMQHVDVRNEGEAAASTSAQPGLVAKDDSGNLAYIPLTPEGSIPVDTSPGSEVSATGFETISALNTDTDIATITIDATSEYSHVQAEGYSSQPCYWKVVSVDDAAGTPVETILAQGFSSSGSYKFETIMSNIKFTSGSTGVQELKLVCKQLRGPLSDSMGQVCAIKGA